jgi:hypothetical protein
METGRIIAQGERLNRREYVCSARLLGREKMGGLELQAKAFLRYPARDTFIGTHQIHPAAGL